MLNLNSRIVIIKFSTEVIAKLYGERLQQYYIKILTCIREKQTI